MIGAVLFSVFLSISALGSNHLRLTYLGLEQGLSNNNVTSVYQDRHGFMWFGTYDGLNRYDGYSFKVFRNIISDSSSLSNDRINCVEGGFGDEIWIGTGKGASVYNHILFQFRTIRYLPYGQTNSRKMEFSINSIKPDGRGNMLLAGKGGLLLCRSASEPAVQVPLLSGDSVTKNYEAVVVECDPGGQVWVLVRHAGLCIYDYDKRGLRVVDERVKDNAICLKSDKDGHLWIGAIDGVYRFSVLDHQLIEKKLNYRVVNLSFDKEQNLWVSSDGGGAFTIDPACSTVTQRLSPEDNASLSSLAVYAVYEDKEGRKWIATLRGGITIADPNKQLFEPVLRFPDNQQYTRVNFINCFCEDSSHHVWIGTDGGGVSSWDRRTNAFTDYKQAEEGLSSIHNNVIVSLLTDHRGFVWLAEWLGGFDQYDPVKRQFRHFPCYNTVTHAEDKFAWLLYEDSQHDLWAATSTGGGLYHYNEAKGGFELFDNELKDILIMAEDREGRLWAGDYGEDLIEIDRKGGKHKRYPIGARVRTIHEDKYGNFWIGTEEGGLLLFDRQKGTYVRYTQANGLPSNSILSMLEDGDGHLWMGTYNGLSKFDPERKTFKNYSVSDGLQSNQYNYNTALRLSSGEFIFGGLKGSSIFNPAAVNNREKAQTAPALLLTELQIGNIPIESDTSLISQMKAGLIEELKIPYEKAVVTFDFVALEYSAPDKIDYAYYMDGVDRGWNRIGKRRSASFSQLREGMYTFRVRSTSADGRWNQPGMAIRLIVLPPWYRTWLAYLIYIILAAAGLYTYLWYVRKREQLSYEIKLAHLETEKERQLNEKKLQFFTNITHEFRTPLTLIFNPVREMLKNETRDLPGLKAVYRNARRLLGLVDQLLLFRKAGTENDHITVTNIDFEGLCAEVYAYFTKQALTKQIDYRYQRDQENAMVFADREKMEIVLYNIVSNAMRFTPEGGKIVFDVRQTEQEVLVTISDSGPGIDEGAGNRIFERFYQAEGNPYAKNGGFGIGLFLVKYFAGQHEGKVWYTSKQGEGTTFYLQLKKGTAHFDSTVRIIARQEAGEYDRPVPEAEPADSPAPVLLQRANVSLTDKKTLLIVDDNEEIRSYIRRLFQQEMNVLDADNGVVGLELCREFTPDIVISDVVMPGMDGVLLCKNIKTDPELSHIPVILLTAVTSPEVRLQGTEEGADDYITKPFENEFFIARVHNILKARTTLQDYYFDKITLRDTSQKVSAEDKEFLDRCISIVEENLDNENFNISVMTEKVGMSRSNLYRKVRAISGDSINAFIRSIRLRKAAVLLLSTDLHVNQVAFQVGINDVKYFRMQFKKVFGMNPSEYVKKYRAVFNSDFQTILAKN
jgi:signal transduction histidine kinase/ligand-binding sensor domain-containing protein/DNA-binding response OmpR family regulator